ncbi:MAG: hypothetical protein ABUL57_01145, partial [Chloroflexota bacterium]
MFERTRLMKRTRRMLAVLIAVAGLLTLSLGSAMAHSAKVNGGRHVGWAAHDWSSKISRLEASEATDEDDADESDTDEAGDEDDQGEDEDAQDENDD